MSSKLLSCSWIQESIPCLEKGVNKSASSTSTKCPKAECHTWFCSSFFLKQSCLHAAQRSRLWRSSDEWLKTIIAIIRYSTYLNYSFHSASAGDAVQRPSVGFPIRIINLQKTSSRISINCDVLVLAKTVSVPAAYLNFKRIAHYFDISILIRL